MVDMSGVVEPGGGIPNICSLIINGGSSCIKQRTIAKHDHVAEKVCFIEESEAGQH